MHHERRHLEAANFDVRRLLSRFKRQTIATEPSDEISRGIPIAFDGHVAVVAVVADEETALSDVKLTDGASHDGFTVFAEHARLRAFAKEKRSTVIRNGEVARFVRAVHVDQSSAREAFGEEDARLSTHAFTSQ